MLVPEVLASIPEMGVLIDHVKPKRSGITNVGNTAQGFHNYEDSTRVTDINKHLLMRCAVIFLAPSCGFQINMTAFHEYARL